MKRIFFVLALVAPCVCAGQVIGGLQAGVYDCSLAGHSTLPGGGVGYTGGVWAELKTREWMGVKVDVSYAQRKGATEGEAFRADAAVLSALLRFHLQEVGSSVRLVAGVGGFMQLPVFSTDGVKALDAGPGLEIGLEIGRVSVVLFGQAGLSDVVSAVDRKQRWAVVGLGVQGRLW